MVIAGLGVLNDVTITQASAVWELHAANPALSRVRLFTGGMRIGRDHIASTVYHPCLRLRGYRAAADPGGLTHRAPRDRYHAFR